LIFRQQRLLLGEISFGGEWGRQESEPAVLTWCTTNGFRHGEEGCSSIGLAVCERKYSPSTTHGAQTEDEGEHIKKEILI